MQNIIGFHNINQQEMILKYLICDSQISYKMFAS